MTGEIRAIARISLLLRINAMEKRAPPATPSGTGMGIAICIGPSAVRVDSVSCVLTWLSHVAPYSAHRRRGMGPLLLHHASKSTPRNIYLPLIQRS